MAIKISSLLISSFLTFLLIVHPTLALQHGFTTDLIHRESPNSPLYNPSLNKYERLRNSIQRSMSKFDQFWTSSSSSSSSSSSPSSSSPGDAESQVTAGNGEYLINLSFGTPPVSQVVIVDTGSDLTWIQCQPCSNCYEQKLPIWDPLKSSTYKLQSCDAQVCKAMRTTSCTSNNTCAYTYKYGDKSDRSHTTGDLAFETITFNSNVSFPNVTIGCGHDNAGDFKAEWGSGVIGLGASGPLSLASQLGFGKFSYCFIPFDKESNFTSKMNFGTKGEVSGPGVISTPIAKGSPYPSFYFLTLKGISVGKTKIPFYKTPSTEADYGDEAHGIIIDSGTTLTQLPYNMYPDFESAVKVAIKGKIVDDPSGQLKLCYSSTNDGRDLNIPDVTLHFKGGDLVLKPINTFIQVADGVVCLAFIPGSVLASGAILGNMAQMNFLVGYDTVEGKVSFKPTDCSKQ